MARELFWANAPDGILIAFLSHLAQRFSKTEKLRHRIWIRWAEVHPKAVDGDAHWRNAIVITYKFRPTPPKQHLLESESDAATEFIAEALCRSVLEISKIFKTGVEKHQ